MMHLPQEWIDNTSTSSLEINKITEHENCFELRTEIEEAVKILMDDCGEQNDELLILRDQLNSN